MEMISFWLGFFVGFAFSVLSFIAVALLGMRHHKNKKANDDKKRNAESKVMMTQAENLVAALGKINPPKPPSTYKGQN